MKAVFFKTLTSFLLIVTTFYHSAAAADYFVENKGQLRNQYGQKRDDVLFYTHIGNTAVFITGQSLIYETRKQETNESGNWVHSHRCELELLNASSKPLVSEVKYNRFPEFHYGLQSGEFSVRSLSSFTIANIYPHIDWVWTFDQGQLKYDFVVKPGGDLNDIQILIKGADFSISQFQELNIRTLYGDIREGALLILQNNKPVEGNWQLKNQVLSIQARGFNPNETLVIDPVVRVWGSYLGGSADDEANDVIADDSGNVYLAGQTSSSNNMVTSGAFQQTNSGGWDGFLSKFNSEGILLWSSFLGSSGTDVVHALATDAAGNIYLAGHTNASGLIATTGVHQTINAGLVDAIVAKFNAQGQRIWLSYFGGEGGDFARGIALDANANVYIVGYTASQSGIAFSGAHQSQYGGGNFDAFLASFNSSGQLVYSTYMGGAAADYAFSCAIRNNHLVVAGESASTNNIATPAAHQTNNNGFFDAFIARFTLNGTLIWSTYFGEADNETAHKVAIDGNDNLVIAGTTYSQSGIATLGAHQTAFGGGTNDAMIAKFSIDGTLLFSTYLGGNNIDEGFSCAVDAQNNFYLIGWTFSSSQIATSNAYQLAHAGARDAFISCFSSNNELMWSTYYGGAQHDRAYAAFIANNHLFVAGRTSSLDAIASNNGHQQVFGGVADAFVVKFALGECAPVNIVSSAANNLICSGETLLLQANSSQPYQYTWLGLNAGAVLSIVPTQNTVIELQATDGNCLVNMQYAIQINPLPEASFSYLPTDNIYEVQFLNTSEHAQSFQYILNGQSISDVENPLYQFPFDGDFPVVLIASNACGSDTISSMVEVIKTGIADAETMIVKLFPNPVKDILVIHAEIFQTQKCILEIFDLQGRLKLKTQIQLHTHQSIGLKDFAPGMYLLSIRDEVNQTHIQKKFILN